MYEAEGEGGFPREANFAAGRGAKENVRGALDPLPCPPLATLVETERISCPNVYTYGGGGVYLFL